MKSDMVAALVAVVLEGDEESKGCESKIEELTATALLYLHLMLTSFLDLESVAGDACGGQNASRIYLNVVSNTRTKAS